VEGRVRWYEDEDEFVGEEEKGYASSLRKKDEERAELAPDS
jgi:hypothetical protein